MKAVRPAIRRTSSTSMQAVRAPSLPAPVFKLTAPRRYATVQMPAVVPLSTGRMLDDSFDFDIDSAGALELDCLPSSHHTRVEQPRQSRLEPRRATPAPMARISPRGILPPPMSSSGARRSSSTVAAVDPHAALVAFAGFGDPPPGLFGTPTYALRVIFRRRALNADLALARERRSPDVGLYEASLRTVDAGAVRMGLVVATMMLTLTVLLVAAVVHLVHPA